MDIVALGFGSNIGDSRDILEKTINLLSQNKVYTVKVATPRLYPPLYHPEDTVRDQNDYTNTVIVVQTLLSPENLLSVIKNIEESLGRKRKSSAIWEARPVDLDILLWEDLVYRSPCLEVPHPELAQRLFVLEPLAEVLPNAIHPTLKLTIGKILENLRKV